jgi:hypothetical protein
MGWRLPPRALLMPISRLRPATETNMMFMSLIPDQQRHVDHTAEHQELSRGQSGMAEHVQGSHVKGVTRVQGSGLVLTLPRTLT